MITLPSINTSADTFQSLFDKVNAVINTIANSVVTSNNSANGAVTTGNGYISGIFSSNVFATPTLRGGNVQTSATLDVISNTNFSTVVNVSTQILVGNSTTNVIANSSSLKIGNFIANNTVVSIGNSTVNTVVNTSSFKVGSNVVVGTGSLFIGNTTSNAEMNLTTLKLLGGVSLNSIAFVVNNFNVNSSSINILTTSLTDTTLKIGNSTVNSVLNTTSMVIGTAVHNTTGFFVGSNAIVNTSTLKINDSYLDGFSLRVGNSTSFAVLNSTGMFIDGQPNTVSTPNNAKDSISLNNADVITASRINLINGNNILIETSLDNSVPQANVIISLVDLGFSGTDDEVFYRKNNKTFSSSTLKFTNNELIATNNVRANSISTNTIFVGNTKITSFDLSIAAASANLIDSFSSSEYRAAEYSLTISNPTTNAYSVAKLHLIHNGLVVQHNQYSLLQTNGAIHSITANINAGVVRLYLTPTFINTNVKLVRTV